MKRLQADIVVCGAGIAGVSCATQLARALAAESNGSTPRILLVDMGPPLSMTSDKSTECYRNWWPGPGNAVVRFMNRSIDLLEAEATASGNRFVMNRRGYLFATADPNQALKMHKSAAESEQLGVGPFREHGRGAGASYQPGVPDGWPVPGLNAAEVRALNGVDLLTDPVTIRQHFPYLHPDTVAVLHARRCGWLSAQQLGAYWLEDGKERGVNYLNGRVTGLETERGSLSGVRVDGAAGSLLIDTTVFVNCAGPMAPELGVMSGQELPLVCEGHVKITFDDHLGAIDRRAPLLIWEDPVTLPWSDEERAALAESPETAVLVAPFEAGVHGRPLGGLDAQSVVLYWPYDLTPSAPNFPLEWDPNYPEIVIRGMSAMIPGLAQYFDHLPRPFVDGGYYCKTPENRPLIGPMVMPGTYICAAFSGFGIMASAAAGELLTAHVLGRPLPSYASAFELSRYQDPEYQTLLSDWPDSGQL